MSAAIVLVGLLGSVGAGAQPCGTWSEVEVPAPGTFRNAAVDVDAAQGTLVVLLSAKDNTIINGDQHFHVLRRDGDAWTDLGEPDVSAIEAASFGLEGVTWTAVAAQDDGSIWLAGEHEPLAQVNRGFQRPVFAKWTSGGGWSSPESFELLGLAPVAASGAPRGGSVFDLRVAPDGAVIAVGQSAGWGGLSENNGSIPMLLRNTGSGWEELNVTDRDWPGSRGSTFVSGVVAFSADDFIAAGRHPGGNGVGAGALVVGYHPTDGPTLVSTPANGGQPNANPASAIDAASPDDIWIAGSGGLNRTALLMHFDGSTWNMVASPFGAIASISAVASMPNGNAFVFTALQSPPHGPGAERLAFFDGSAWNIAPFVSPTNGAMSTRVRAARADAGGRVWAVGDRFVAPADPFDTSFATQAFVAVLSCDTPACPCDRTGDGFQTVADFFAFLNDFNAQLDLANPAPGPADFDGSGLVTPADFFAFLNACLGAVSIPSNPCG